MAYIISLKAGHLTGKMQRNGVVVERNQPVIMNKVPKELESEPWFEITKAEGKELDDILAKGATDLRPQPKASDK